MCLIFPILCPSFTMLNAKSKGEVFLESLTEPNNSSDSWDLEVFLTGHLLLFYYFRGREKISQNELNNISTFLANCCIAWVLVYW